jgi:hypothetical protein
VYARLICLGYVDTWQERRFWVAHWIAGDVCYQTDVLGTQAAARAEVERRYGRGAVVWVEGWWDWTRRMVGVRRGW